MKISEIRHHRYLYQYRDWDKWRDCWNGGRYFVEKYLERYSVKEKDTDYNLRVKLTPPNMFATTQILDIANSIYDRLADITRMSKCKTYSVASEGNNGGVDRFNSTMNYFIGIKVLHELLFMGKVGVYIDAPATRFDNLLDNTSPYMYIYGVEQILSWNYDKDNVLNALLLVEHIDSYDYDTGLITGCTKQFRYLRKTPDGILLRILNENSDLINETILELKEIPFVLFELPHSLMSKVCDQQISLMNIESSDLFFIHKGNYPIFVEQVDQQYEFTRNLMRAPVDPNLTTEGSQTAVKAQVENDYSNIDEKQRGIGRAMRIGKNLEFPEYVAPPTDTIKISIEKQEQIKRDIVILLNKSVQALKANRTSAESKQAEVSHEEQGLNYIGLELCRGERAIERIWCMYEGVTETGVIQYPSIYRIKSDEDRIAEAEKYHQLTLANASTTYRKEVAKKMSRILLENKISPEKLQQIYIEIDKNNAPIPMDVKSLVAYLEHNVFSPSYLTELLGIPVEEAAKAEEAHARRAAAVVRAQMSVKSEFNSKDPNNDPINQEQRDANSDDNLVKQEI